MWFKISQWMWYMFPQIIGLGNTEAAKIYAIKNIEEAMEFLMDQEVGLRLINICKVLLELEKIRTQT